MMGCKNLYKEMLSSKNKNVYKLISKEETNFHKINKIFNKTAINKFEQIIKLVQKN